MNALFLLQLNMNYLNLKRVCYLRRPITKLQIEMQTLFEKAKLTVETNVFNESLISLMLKWRGVSNSIKNHIFNVYLTHFFFQNIKAFRLLAEISW